MKWRSHPRPHWGSIRYRRLFAVLPRRCENGQTVWLEHVDVIARFNGDYWACIIRMPARDAVCSPEVGLLWKRNLAFVNFPPKGNER